MPEFFGHTYRFFRRRQVFFFIAVACLFAGMAWLASRIRFEEDILGQTKQEGAKGDILSAARNLGIADKLIVDICLADSLASPDPGRLAEAGRQLTDSLAGRFGKTHIRSVTFRTSDTTFFQLMELVRNHLPSFYDEADYRFLDSLFMPGAIDRVLADRYRMLLSPAGMVMKKRIREDPLRMEDRVLGKMRSLSGGEEFTAYDGCIFSSDLRHLLIFIAPANPAAETARNGELIAGLERISRSISIGPSPQVRVQYFGGVAVAVANARQLKKDIALTLAIAVVLIFLLTGCYFKSIRVPLLGLLPAVFGGLFSLALLYLFKGTISAISLGIGSVILGLIIDYSLYLVNHFRKKRDMEAAVKEMWLNIVLCSLTSAGAFLCLTLLSSSVLRDLGWFAALSVIGAALFTLLILPQFITGNMVTDKRNSRGSFIDRIAAIPYERKPWIAAILAGAVILSLFFAGKAGFEKDMSSLSYMTPELQKAESDLDRISNYRLKSVYSVTTGETMEKALRHKEILALRIERLRERGIIRGTTDAGPLLVSDSLQQLRIDRWNHYWTPERQEELKTALQSAASRYGFRTEAFEPFFELLHRNFEPFDIPAMMRTVPSLTTDWLTVKDASAMATSVLRVAEGDKEMLYRDLPVGPHHVLFDRQTLAQEFVGQVRNDFELLVRLSMAFVTLLLVFSFGRLGLGLITAAPMFLSWVITLGFMGMTGTRFNIFNIIISSFIFGLGVDYSILMTRGLQQALRTGRNEIQTYRVAVLLSSLTTLFGVGALFFAGHPALRSIAAISVVGIVAVVLFSFLLPPMIFDRFILGRVQQGKFPVTFRILIKTLVTWGNIVLIAIILMTLGTLINLFLPVSRKRKESMFHRLFSRLTRAYIAFTFAFDRKLINEPGEDFSRPAIIISNHQSLIETPAFLRLYPKIIILTTTWVYRSPIFGPIARLANFYNVDEGIEAIAGELKKKMDEGFLVLIFPEGHRSRDQRIQRFHRGAFYLAEKLQVDILPMMVFGSGDFLAKGDFWGKPNSLRMKILSRVRHDDPSFGATYQERARNFRQFYIREYARFRAEEGNTHYYRRLVALNYVMKGPVLEWYMRVKMKLENDFELYDRLLPRSGTILDLGCGYGFISCMLMFTGEGRVITGIDYDPEKIEVAASCFSANERIHFICADICGYDMAPADGFLLGDVLHYLEPGQQRDLLRRCCANLLPGGTILVREANAELESRHKRSKLTEFFSTRSGFNKTASEDKRLHFTSASEIREIALAYGLSFEVVDNKKITSNNLFVIRKG